MATVLLVEDDPAILRLYKKTFELEKYEVETADNGLSALEQIPVSKPDIILLDIMMPTMNGIEMLKRFTGSQYGAIPVICLTNVVDENVKTEAVEAGASLVLVKSDSEPEEVVKAVKQVLAGEILQKGDDLDAPEDGEPANS